VDRQTNEIEIDVFQLIRALWRKIWLIILAAVICGSLGFAYSGYYLQPLYAASTLMYVNNSSFSLNDTYFSISASELAAAQSLVETYLVILKTNTTLEEVIDKAGLNYTYEELCDMISASDMNDTEVFKITVTSPDPKEAKLIANTIAEVLPEKISAIVDGSSVRVVDYAVMPDKKVFPSITRFTAIGIAIGGVLSCIGIVVAELLDDSIYSIDMIPRSDTIPLLSSVPNLHTSGRGNYGYRRKRRAYGYYEKEKNGER